MQKEVSKLLKRINVEKAKNNHRSCIEMLQVVGQLHSDIGSYEEACHYHEQALDLSKTIGDTFNICICFRAIGECKASLGLFTEAIDNIKRYLELAQKSCDNVEIQRAFTTLGRVYLMQAQELKESNNVSTDALKIRRVADEAQKRFSTALELAEIVRDQVDAKEYAQMKSSLLNNLALIDEICGRHEECVKRFYRAIDICKKAKLKEDLYRCLVILASIFRKKSVIKLAVKTSEDALQTAKSIGKKILICDAYIERGLVRILQRDFKLAKRDFAQAYLEKSPNEEDHTKAIKFTKLTHLIVEADDKISKENNPSVRMKLYDKLGDLFVALEFYKLAIEYYKRALADAKLSNQPKSQKAKILYSIAETYVDDCRYDLALSCYEMELKLREGNNHEECQSLVKIASMQDCLNRDPEEVSMTYEKAYEKANKNPKLMYNVLREYVPYLERKAYNYSKLEQLRETLSNLASYPEIQDDIDREGEEEAEELDDEIANIDDIISDYDDDDEVLMVGRRRAKGNKKFKANEVGDTPLHEAAIKGDLKRVRHLISEGHEINPRDNAGWIPLHEACNHGYYEIAEVLIDHGADVNNRGLKGMSPLHDAATNGHFDIMRLLIKNGANVIALTDTGETVLNCLRDYKKRNYDTLKNSQLSEYRQIECELLNIMDKKGFNLMESNIKNLNAPKNNTNRASTSFSPSSSVTTSYNSTTARQDNPKLPPKSRMNVLKDSAVLTNPVREYRDTISTLKRKRKVLTLDSDEEDESDKQSKRDLPAIYETSDNTSKPTKEWLIDDVSRTARLKINPLPHFTDYDPDIRFSDDDDDIQISSPHLPKERIQVNDSQEVGKTSPIEELLIDDSCESSPPMILPTPSPITETSVKSFPMSDSMQSVKFDNHLKNPLVVTIEDRKLMIPIKDEHKTIKWLKETIAERYSVVTDGAKPNISLTPVSDNNCILYDDDLCYDVIRENLVAIIDSWQIDTVGKCYIANCSKFNIEPLKGIMNELNRIQDSTTKLDLSYCFIPRNHVIPVVQALGRRNFVDVRLSGCSCLFDFDHSESEFCELLNSIISWKKLNNLRLDFTGLRWSQFERMCSKMRLPELKSLDLTDNLIVQKCKKKFESNIENLYKGCPNLKKIDLEQ